MERLILENQTLLLNRSQPTVNEIQINLLIAAVQFVSNNRVANVRQVDANLMFSPGLGSYAQKSKRLWPFV